MLPAALVAPELAASLGGSPTPGLARGAASTELLVPVLPGPENPWLPRAVAVGERLWPFSTACRRRSRRSFFSRQSACGMPARVSMPFSAATDMWRMVV